MQFLYLCGKTLWFYGYTVLLALVSIAAYDISLEANAQSAALT
jgi:hypothetical protein